MTPGEVSVASKRLSKWASLTQIPAKYWVCTGTWIMWDYSVPFRNLCFLHPLVLPYTSPVTLQSHIFWGLIFGIGPPSWGAQCRPQTPPSLERTFAVVVIFSFVDCLPEGGGGVGQIILCLYHPCPSHCGSFFISLVLEKSFLLVFRLFSLIVLCN